MSLLHGFLNVRENTVELSEVISWLSSHGGFNIHSSGMNGELVYQIFSSRNGSSSSWKILKEKLTVAIERGANDTYGLFFIYDEGKENDDNWVVWRLASREITEVDDNLLSPYSEVIDSSGEED